MLLISVIERLGWRGYSCADLAPYIYITSILRFSVALEYGLRIPLHMAKGVVDLEFVFLDTLNFCSQEPRVLLQ